MHNWRQILAWENPDPKVGDEIVFRMHNRTYTGIVEAVIRSKGALVDFVDDIEKQTYEDYRGTFPVYAVNVDDTSHWLLESPDIISMTHHA